MHDKYRRFVPLVRHRERPELPDRRDDRRAQHRPHLCLRRRHTRVRIGTRIGTGLLGCEFVAGPRNQAATASRTFIRRELGSGEPLAAGRAGLPDRGGRLPDRHRRPRVTAGGNIYALLQDKAGEWSTLTYNDWPSATARVSVRTLRSERRPALPRVGRAQPGVRGRAPAADRLRAHPQHDARPASSSSRSYFYPQSQEGFDHRRALQRRRLHGRHDHRPPRARAVGDDPAARGQARAQSRARLPRPDRGADQRGHRQQRRVLRRGDQDQGPRPVIGMRTWGGAIGIEPHQDLVDGGGTTPPQFGLYGLDGTWLIEGWGVEPDSWCRTCPATWWRQGRSAGGGHRLPARAHPARADGHSAHA
jgi:hypothetical protein